MAPVRNSISNYIHPTIIPIMVIFKIMHPFIHSFLLSITSLPPPSLPQKPIHIDQPLTNVPPNIENHHLTPNTKQPTICIRDKRKRKSKNVDKSHTTKRTQPSSTTAKISTRHTHNGHIPQSQTTHQANRNSKLHKMLHLVQTANAHPLQEPTNSYMENLRANQKQLFANRSPQYTKPGKTRSVEPQTDRNPLLRNSNNSIHPLPHTPTTTPHNRSTTITNKP